MSSNLKGALLALFSSGFSALTLALVKFTSDQYHVVEILFFRQMILLIAVIPALASAFPARLTTRHPGLHALRLFCAFVALLSSFWAASVLPLTTSTVLSFSKVFFVSLLAAAFLGEAIRLQRSLAILVGFIGVLIVVRPGTDGFASLYALVALLGAFTGSIATTTIRRLTRTEHVATLMGYQAVFVGCLVTIPLFFVWKTPDLEGLLLMISIGISSVIAQYYGLTALKYAEAGIVACMAYVKLIYATLFGFLIFSSLPDVWTLTGAALIIGASIFTMYREARAEKSPKEKAGRKKIQAEDSIS
ncbi:MAG: DMT family transporter [Cohaesibacteraceae bacterium]|nr:DMT family transporter [Cohaesibacteraceae bacterium]